MGQTLWHRIDDEPTQHAVKSLDRRLSTAIEDIATLQTSSTGGGITLPIAMTDVTGLVAALAGKAATSHTHVKADVTDFAHTHAEADVTGLVADLAAKVPTTRAINTNTPLSGGGSLSGDLTLSVTLPSPTTDIYGDGSDGDATISADTQLTRDTFYDDLTVDSGFSLRPMGYRLFVRGTLTLAGTIHDNGVVGSAGGTNVGASGGAGRGGTIFAQQVSGGASLSTGTSTTPASNPAFAGGDNAGGGGGARGTGAGVPGSPGNPGTGRYKGGGGGGGGWNTGGLTSNGAAGGIVTPDAESAGSRPNQYLVALLGRGATAVSQKFCGSGGGCGGGGSASADDGCGGGGGSGAGHLFVAARYITGTGTIEARGGAGGAGGGGNNGGGGGGGGGGGNVCVFTQTALASLTITTSAAGGAGGIAGVGTSGTNGGAGGAGGPGVVSIHAT